MYTDVPLYNSIQIMACYHKTNQIPFKSSMIGASVKTGLSVGAWALSNLGLSCAKEASSSLIHLPLYGRSRSVQYLAAIDVLNCLN